MPRRIKIEEGSGNVYADIGLPNPEEALAKADLAREIIRIISERRLTQLEAGKLLGIGQPRVSQLMRGRLSDFSLERLIEFAKTLKRVECADYDCTGSIGENMDVLAELHKALSGDLARIAERFTVKPRLSLVVRFPDEPGKGLYLTDDTKAGMLAQIEFLELNSQRIFEAKTGPLAQETSADVSPQAKADSAE